MRLEEFYDRDKLPNPTPMHSWNLKPIGSVAFLWTAMKHGLSAQSPETRAGSQKVRMNPQPSSHYQVTKETSTVRERAPEMGFLIREDTEFSGLESGCRSREKGRVP